MFQRQGLKKMKTMGATTPAFGILYYQNQIEYIFFIHPLNQFYIFIEETNMKRDTVQMKRETVTNRATNDRDDSSGPPCTDSLPSSPLISTTTLPPPPFLFSFPLLLFFFLPPMQPHLPNLSLAEMKTSKSALSLFAKMVNKDDSRGSTKRPEKEKSKRQLTDSIPFFLSHPPLHLASLF